MRRGILGGILLVLLLASSVAAVEPAEREAYAERAEPVCKANVLANQRIFKGTEAEVKRGQLKKASGAFMRAARAFGKTIRQLDAIPKPPDDTTRLSKWIGLLRDEKDLIKKIGLALAAENKRKAESISVELNRNSSKANNVVLPYGFDYCRIEPSRFR